MSERKEQIAEQFKKHFHHYGFKKTSVDDIAAELHISKKTIYEYFDSKEAVFAYVIQGEANRVVVSIQHHLETINSAKEKLAVLIHLIFEQARIYLDKTRNLDFNNQEDIASLAFETAYMVMIKQVVSEGSRDSEFGGLINDLTLAFINAILKQGIQKIKSDPDSHPEQQTLLSILKLLT
jgi:AcrR family transcriptional regulator